jgi:hypothetical protein
MVPANRSSCRISRPSRFGNWRAQSRVRKDDETDTEETDLSFIAS